MIDTKRLATDAGYWRECGAPDCATHYSPNRKEFVIAGPGWAYGIDKKYKSLERLVYPRFPERIPRPQSEWVDVLPPVGTKCELNLYGYWIVATVLAYGKTKFLYEISPGQIDTDGDPIGGELEGFIKRAQFRPILTKEQRDREDLKSIIADFEHYGHDYVTDKIIAAGWTKP